MKACKTCKHWDTQEGIFKQLIDGFGVCKYADEYWASTDWDYDENDIDSDCVLVLDKKHANHKSFTQDGSDYRSDLITRHDFYCSEYEPKN